MAATSSVQCKAISSRYLAITCAKTLIEITTKAVQQTTSSKCLKNHLISINIKAIEAAPYHITDQSAALNGINLLRLEFFGLIQQIPRHASVQRHFVQS